MSVSRYTSCLHEKLASQTPEHDAGPRLDKNHLRNCERRNKRQVLLSERAPESQQVQY